MSKNKTMKTNIHSLCPLDGRYEPSVKELRDYFSEYATIKERVHVEIKYFLALLELDETKNLNDLDASVEGFLQMIIDDFNEQDAITIKKIEAETNHDVKAIEYFIKEKMEESGYGKWKEMVHFGLTSQDIVSTAFGCQLKKAYKEVLLPNLIEVINSINFRSFSLGDIPMLARTHGQPASPTNLGKELLVFHSRLNKQLKILDAIPITAKFGGAVGNLSAHVVTYPTVNWQEFADKFVNDLVLKRNSFTTQIDHYDDLAAFLDCWRRIQVILLDFTRDMWQYISMGYLVLDVNEKEVGSSTMPHKINPIDFENSEGNLGLSIALCTHLSTKLPVSRLQRDLSDSTVLRNVGTLFGYTLLALKGLRKGLNKVQPNKAKIKEDLYKDWSVIGEAIQSILRREGYPGAYDKVKAFTRNNECLNQKQVHAFIKGLDIKESVKEELLKLTPGNVV